MMKLGDWWHMFVAMDHYQGEFQHACLGQMHLITHVWAHVHTHGPRPKKKLKAIPLPCLIRLSGSEEAPWKDLYHLQSIKSECGMSYGCIFINTLKVDGE